MAGTESSDAVSIVKRCYVGWSAGDIPAILNCLSDDCVYALNVPQDVLEFAGEHTGKPAIEQCLTAMLREFSYLAIAVDSLVANDGAARAQIVYYYRHNDSGQRLDGRLRHVWTLAAGRVVRLEEFHDVALLKAFLAMVRGLRKT